MLTIIDYGVGNIFAFQNVYKRLNIPTKVAKNIEDLANVDKLILPGVGNFDYAMNQLNNSGLRTRLDELVLINKIPVIGICIGMQIMANDSEEGISKGLGWIDASVKKFNSSKIEFHTKLPHMGWNDVIPIGHNKLFEGLDKNSIFYFLHSYYFSCHNKNQTISTSEYGIKFTSCVQHENIYGIQFNPEKSHSYGEKLLHNFAKL